MSTFHVTGVENVIRLFSALSPSERRRAARPALRRAATPVNAAARRLVPVDTGRLRRSFTTTSMTDKEEGALLVSAGPSYSRRNKKYAPHAHFTDMGTKVRQARSGANRGRVMPVRFMLRAFLASRFVAQRILRQQLLVGIDKAMARRSAK